MYSIETLAVLNAKRVEKEAKNVADRAEEKKASE